MLKEADGLAYKIYNDYTQKHIANIYYDSKTNRYRAELLEKNLCPSIFNTLEPGGARFIFGSRPNPDSELIITWLKERVIPENRQMLKKILEANGLYEYDWRVLIRLNHGKCTDDDFRVEAVEWSI